MRLFIGIKTGCENELTLLQSELRKAGKGSFTDPDNLHITLKFLGEAPFSGVKGICEAMSETRSAPVSLECLGAKVFNKSGIVSAGVGGELGKLSALVSGLETALENRGFAKETRPYRPHITLARNFRPFDGCDIASLPYQRRGFKVEEIILFESRRDAGRLVYAPLFVHRLDGGRA